MNQHLKLSETYIGKDQCVLFLGPRFAMDKNGKKAHELLKDHLLSQNYNFDNRFDNLFIINDSKGGDSVARMMFNIELSDFYNNFEPHAVYDLIAEIPFTAVVNCSPDIFLNKSLDKLGVRFDFQYFSPKATKENSGVGPIIYNLFGKMDNQGSLITTFDSFYTFVFSLLSNGQQLPIRLKNALANAQVLMFFGFDFAKWYIPLILRRLSNNSEIKLDENIPALISKETFYDKEEIRLHFNKIDLNFMEEETVPFLTELNDLLKSKGKLRSQRENFPSVSDIRIMIGNDQIREAILALKDLFQRSKMDANPIVAISGRFKNLSDNFVGNLISDEAAGIERERIRSGLLIFCDQFEQAVPAQF